MSGIETIRAILKADPATQALVGDRIGPKPAAYDKPPYIILFVSGGEPFNQLSGFAGLNRTEVELVAWSRDYDEAVAIATAARAAIEAAGNFTLHEPGDEQAFEGDVALFGHAYVFQIFE